MVQGKYWFCSALHLVAETQPENIICDGKNEHVNLREAEISLFL